MGGGARTVRVAAVPVLFPEDRQPFPTQLALMGKMLQALRAGENALLESPTGTGKALAALCGVLSWQRHAQAEPPAAAPAGEAKKPVTADATAAGDGTPPDGDAAKPACTCDLARASPTSRSKYFGSRTATSASPGPKFSLLGADDDDDDDNVDDMDENDFATLNGRRVVTPKGIKRKREREKARETCPAHGRNAALKRRATEVNDDDDVLPSSMRVKLADVDQAAATRMAKKQRVYIASRTHSQLAQLASELKACPDELVNGVRMVILGSRKQYCVNTRVTRKRSMGSAAARNEECRRLLSANGPGCGFFKPNAGGRLRAAVTKTSPVWDIEDLVDAGKRLRCCPYFATREMAVSSDVILAPYNYLFEPMVREAMGIDLRDAVIVIDEAHNIADVCRDAASAELSLPRLEQVRNELEELAAHGALENQAAFRLLGGFMGKIFSWARARAPKADAGRPVVLDGLDALLQLEAECGLDEDALDAVQQIYLSIKATATEKVAEDNSNGGAPALFSPLSRTVLERVLNVFDFMLADHRKFASDFRVVVRRVWGQDAPEVCFWCMNAAAAFEPVAKQSRSVVLTSGTLAPLTSFASELGVPFKFTLEAPHVIDVRKQMFAGVVTGAMTPVAPPRLVRLEGVYANKSKLEYQDALGCALAQLLQAVPDGALVFFPSYSFMRVCVDRWRASPTWPRLAQAKSQIFVETSAGRAEETDEASEGPAGFDAQLEAYRKAVDSGAGALFLGVFRGKLSEGLNFSDRDARGVFICGIPFPNARDRAIELKKDYQDKLRAAAPAGSYVLSGQDWYSQQAYRALNQALGRVIRHKNDHGAVLFLDARFEKPNVQRNLPKWMRGTVRDSQPLELTMRALSDFFARQPKQPGPAPQARPPSPQQPARIEHYFQAKSKPAAAPLLTHTVEIPSAASQLGTSRITSARSLRDARGQPGITQEASQQQTAQRPPTVLAYDRSGGTHEGPSGPLEGAFVQNPDAQLSSCSATIRTPCGAPTMPAQTDDRPGNMQKRPPGPHVKKEPDASCSVGLAAGRPCGRALDEIVRREGRTISSSKLPVSGEAKLQEQCARPRTESARPALAAEPSQGSAGQLDETPLVSSLTAMVVERVSSSDLDVAAQRGVLCAVSAALREAAGAGVPTLSS